ncbi:RNA polymerase sigma-70 factor [Mucilaginibacter sp. RS28]|uniref:RNA polymerase sigma-70 factor n=1 Tax=Mucilaginibacter straminoryzae TaxID=2932774 RepID=A0A9X1X072_9SPHI|nr:RNA polymerase sigma-70 factor [Mucilaginibacter straminoryzae]MCJ8208837.1 RNA polymerase sigma-70 factor [Mucilaginibacter straminoryzae]
MPALNTASDQELVSLLREGSEEAYAEIYNRYKWLLHTHAYKKLGDREAANDVIQELFAALWTKRQDIFLTTTLSAYLYTATRNRILNIIEHEKVESRYVDSLLVYANNYVASTDHLIRERQLMEIIEKEIAALPPKMREVFELSRKSHLSHKEIAEELSISEETVKKQIKNALKILRMRLGIVIYIILLTNF